MRLVCVEGCVAVILKIPLRSKVKGEMNWLAGSIQEKSKESCCVLWLYA